LMGFYHQSWSFQHVLSMKQMGYKLDAIYTCLFHQELVGVVHTTQYIEHCHNPLWEISPINQQIDGVFHSIYYYCQTCGKNDMKRSLPILGGVY
jgi:hypothetical protein